jgi:hypothetical protein
MNGHDSQTGDAVVLGLGQRGGFDDAPSRAQVARGAPIGPSGDVRSRSAVAVGFDPT